MNSITNYVLMTIYMLNFVAEKSSKLLNSQKKRTFTSVIASQTPCLQVLFIVSNSKHKKPETISRPTVLFSFLINFCSVYIDSFLLFYFFLFRFLPFIAPSLSYLFLSVSYFLFLLFIFLHTYRVCTTLNHSLL